MPSEFYITEEQFFAIQTARLSSQENRADMYDLIYLAVKGPTAVVPPGKSQNFYAAGNVQAWFGAAAEANRGIGSASTLIRNYTQAQIESRTGQPMENPEVVIQAASNAIADGVFKDIEQRREVIYGNVYYGIPNALEIGEIDVHEFIGSLGVDIAVWSGNPLFLGLGIDKFWADHILNDTSNSYDVFSAITSLKAAGVSGSLSEVGDLFLQFFSGTPFWGTVATVSASNATTDFLYESYRIGTAFPQLFSASIKVGSVNPDTVQLFQFGQNFVHTGSGNDVIYGFSDTISSADAWGVIDGGADIDLVSYEFASGVTDSDYDVFIREISTDVQFSAYVDLPYGGLNSLFNIEILKLGIKDDVLHIDQISTSLVSIDALGNREFGDTINGSSSTSGITVLLNDGDGGSINTIDGSLQVYNFENVVGSNFADKITGSEQTEDSSGRNIIDGRGGSDTIDGRSGDDWIFGGAGTDALYGGSGNDVIHSGQGGDIVDGGDGIDVLTFENLGSEDEPGRTSSVLVDLRAGIADGDTVSNIEVIIGTEFSDTIYGSDASGEFLVGGDGDDIFHVSKSGNSGKPAIVWGGDGVDQIYIDSEAYNIGVPFGSGYILDDKVSVGILSVSISGLDISNVQNFDISKLGYSEQVMDMIDVIVVNADGSDLIHVGRFEYDSPFVPEFETISSISETFSRGNPGDFGSYESFYLYDYVSTDFGGEVQTVFANVATHEEVYEFEYTYVGPEPEPEPDSGEIYDSENYEVSGATMTDSGWSPYNGSGQLYGSSSEFDTVDSLFFFNHLLEPWFILGGHLSGTSLISDQSFQIDQLSYTDVTARGSAAEVYNELLSAATPPAVDPDPAPNPDPDPNPDPGPGDGGSGGSGGSGGIMQLIGTAGNDLINSGFIDVNGKTITDAGQSIYAYAGDDVIYDGAGNDTVYGGDGIDRFYGGMGADHYDGGADHRDEVLYMNAASGLIIDMVDSQNSTGEAYGDTYVNIERVRGTDFADVIRLADNVDANDARAGDDIIYDAAGLEMMKGGAGSDTFVLTAGDGQEDRITDFTIGEDLLDLSAWGVSSLGDLSIAQRTDGSGALQSGLIVSYGLDSVRLDGLTEFDIPSLTANSFILADGSGMPPSDGTVTGTAGADLIDTTFIDADGDLIRNEGQVIVADAGNDTIHDGAGNDLIYGGDGDDVFYGGAGGDSVYGGDGIDRFYGGMGADHYDGGADHRDEVLYMNAASGLIIDMVDSQNSTGEAYGDTYVDIERVRGTNFADVIRLADNVDANDARGGDDIIYDAAGFEMMRGGAGADTFVLMAGDGQEDRINDFTFGEDLLDLSAWGVSSLGDLSIAQRTDGSGALKSGLIVSYGLDSLQLDGFTQSDIPSLTSDNFLFA